MSAIRKLAGQTAVYGVSSIIGRLLNYLLVPLHTAKGNFGPGEYGVISDFYAYVAFFVVLLGFGMETTFFRFVNKAEDKTKTFNQAFSIVLVVNALFLITVLSFAQSIADWMLYPDHKNYVIWFAFVLVFDAISAMFLARLRFLEQPKRFALIQLSAIGVNILLNVVFITWLLPENRAFGIGFVFLANLLSSAVKPAMLIKDIRHYRFVWNREMTTEMFRFAWPLMLASFAGIINEVLDRILIKRLLSARGVDYAEYQLGIYAANYKLSIIITLFIQAFRFAAEPFFFAQAKAEDGQKTYSRIMTYFVIVVAMMFLTVTVFIDFFKYFISNPAYWEGLHIVPVLLLANMCLGIYYNQSIWYKLSNQTRFGAYIAIGGAIVTLSLNYILIPVMGYTGSAWTTLIVYAGMVVASYILGQKHYPIKYNLRKVFVFIIAALILFKIDQWVSIENGVISFVFKTVLMLSYVGLVFFIESPLKMLKKQ